MGCSYGTSTSCMFGILVAPRMQLTIFTVVYMLRVLCHALDCFHSHYTIVVVCFKFMVQYFIM